MSQTGMQSVIQRSDGRAVKLVHKTGHIFVCSEACCCGRADKGNRPVPLERLQHEWERRKLRNRVHLTVGGCLGPCELANVAMLLFDGRAIWFHSFETDRQVDSLFDYVEDMLAAGAFLQPRAELAFYQFDAFDWGGTNAGPAAEGAAR